MTALLEYFTYLTYFRSTDCSIRVFRFFQWNKGLAVRVFSLTLIPAENTRPLYASTVTNLRKGANTQACSTWILQYFYRGSCFSGSYTPEYISCCGMHSMKHLYHAWLGNRFDHSSTKILLMMVGLTNGCDLICLELVTMFIQHILAN